ncbi:MAG: hypothetical protein NT069_22680, partial [Planctomycetota bacterium]|nr:hypothetical protein [Planctomycetota bacterium]
MPVPRLTWSRVRLAGWAVLALLVAWIGWLAVTTETGMDSLAQDLRVVTFGCLGPDPDRILHMSSAEQADYWIGLVQRDAAESPESVDRLIEGTYLLAALAKWDANRNQTLLLPRWDEGRSALFARAQEIAPDDHRIWRSKAYLEVGYDHDWDNQPKMQRTLATLREAQRHDPDNALYDYMAAAYLDFTDVPWFQSPEELLRFPERSSADGQWFLPRMSSIAQLPFAVDGGDRHLLQRRCLARLPLSPTERGLVAREMWSHDSCSCAAQIICKGIEDYLERWSAEPFDLSKIDERCWAIINKHVTVNDVRRQLTLPGPVSPTVDVVVRKLEWARLQVLANKANDADPEESNREAHELFQEYEIADSALGVLFERLHYLVDRPRFSSVTRSCSFLVACGLLAASCLGISIRNRSQQLPGPELGEIRWSRLVVTLVGGIACTLVLLAAVLLSDDPPAAAVVGDMLLWIPVPAFAVLCVWPVHRLFKSTMRRRSRILGIVLGGLFFAGWGILYWYISSSVRTSVRSGVLDVCRWINRKSSIESELHHLGRFMTSDWDHSIHEFLEAAALLTVPIGFVLTAGLLLTAVVLTTPGIQRRSFWDWSLGRTPQVTFESVAS